MTEISMAGTVAQPVVAISSALFEQREGHIPNFISCSESSWDSDSPGCIGVPRSSEPAVRHQLCRSRVCAVLSLRIVRLDSSR